jgi:hypothetical protein
VPRWFMWLKFSIPFLILSGFWMEDIEIFNYDY